MEAEAALCIALACEEVVHRYRDTAFVAEALEVGNE